MQKKKSLPLATFYSTCFLSNICLFSRIFCASLVSLLLVAPTFSCAPLPLTPFHLLSMVAIKIRAQVPALSAWASVWVVGSASLCEC